MKFKKINKTKPTKAKAWKAFSLYIRDRDKKCVTCGSTKWLQGGHFVVGRHLSILFDERNCHAQCRFCNVIKKGNMVIYYKFMLKKYGQRVIDELLDLDKKIVQLKSSDYQELERYYKEKLAVKEKK